MNEIFELFGHIKISDFGTAADNKASTSRLLNDDLLLIDLLHDEANWVPNHLQVLDVVLRAFLLLALLITLVLHLQKAFLLLGEVFLDLLIVSNQLCAVTHGQLFFSFKLY